MKKMRHEDIPVNFNNVKSGNLSYKPLVNKETKQPLKDIDYFEILGRWAIDQDKLAKTGMADYGSKDRDTVNFAKTVVAAIDEGKSREEIEQYIQLSVDITR